MSITPYAALTSLMLDDGWTQIDRGERGVLLGKGKARTPVPYELGTGTSTWRNLLVAVAQVEDEPFEQVRSRVDRFLAGMPAIPDSSERAELDLHLEGPGVRHHETAAYDYGRFVATLAETVKELVKDATGLGRYNRDLQIVGGAQAGSVAVVFREPGEQQLEGQSPLPGQEATVTFERSALLSLSQIMNASEQAASTPSDSTLDAHLNLGPSARKSIASLASIMYRAGWIARGHLVAPGLEVVPVVLSLAGALRLQRSASDVQQRVTSVTVQGQLDGWLWSTATMHFITTDGESIRAGVPMVLQTQVARLIVDQKERGATATFEMLERQAPNGGAVSRTYALASITANGQKPKLVDE